MRLAAHERRMWPMALDGRHFNVKVSHFVAKEVGGGGIGPLCAKMAQRGNPQVQATQHPPPPRQEVALSWFAVLFRGTGKACCCGGVRSPQRHAVAKLLTRREGGMEEECAHVRVRGGGGQEGEGLCTHSARPTIPLGRCSRGEAASSPSSSSMCCPLSAHLPTAPPLHRLHPLARSARHVRS